MYNAKKRLEDAKKKSSVFEPTVDTLLGKAPESYYNEIMWDEDADFRNFTEEYIPNGMEFDLEKIQLNWKPKREQLGYHQLSYELDLRKKVV